MTDKEREKFEDIVVAILLSQTDIRQNENGRSLHFTLQERKTSIFLEYLKKYNLHSQFKFDLLTLEGQVLPSIMLESVFKVWVSNHKVKSIDPSSLRANTYYMWISLFANKTTNSVVIPTDLDTSIQYTLSNLFYQQFGVQLSLGPIMQIKPFSPIMLYAFQSNRPIQEGMELSYLLPNKERETMKMLVSEWEQERANYAY